MKAMDRFRRLAGLLRRRGFSGLTNHILGAYALRSRPSFVRAWPRFIQIEVSSRCNMACVQCSRSTLGKPSHQGYMSLKVFRHIMNQFNHYEFLTLHGLGEPLLNPELESMIRFVHARSPWVRIGFNTNGLLLDAERIKSLGRAGLHEIGVSLDAATQSTFERIRGPHDLSSILDRIKEVVQLPSPRPRVSIAMVVMEPNAHEISSFIDLAGDLGVDGVGLCDLSHRWRPQEGDDPMAVRNLETVWREIPKAERKAADRSIDFTYTKLDDVLWPGTFIPCFYLWDYPYITWDGKLTPCCALPYADQFEFGDLTETSFRSLWNGDEYRKMRSQLVANEIPDICEGCHHAEDPAAGHICTCREPNASDLEDRS